MATAKAPALPKTLGGLADYQWSLRENKRKLEAEIKKIDEQLAKSEEVLVEMLNAQGTTTAKGKLASVSLGEPSLHFSFDDEHGGFDAFIAYVSKKKYFHLFQRRVSDAACREIFEKEKAIPGLKHFTKRRLSLKTIS